MNKTGIDPMSEAHGTCSECGRPNCRSVKWTDGDANEVFCLCGRCAYIAYEIWRYPGRMIPAPYIAVDKGGLSDENEP